MRQKRLSRCWAAAIREVVVYENGRGQSPLLLKYPQMSSVTGSEFAKFNGNFKSI